MRIQIYLDWQIRENTNTTLLQLKKWRVQIQIHLGWQKRLNKKEIQIFGLVITNALTNMNIRHTLASDAAAPPCSGNLPGFVESVQSENSDRLNTMHKWTHTCQLMCRIETSKMHIKLLLPCKGRVFKSGGRLYTHPCIIFLGVRKILIVECKNGKIYTSTWFKLYLEENWFFEVCARDTY